jgi:hypothetical protein
MSREQRWRGQVINLPRRGGPLAALRRFFGRFSRNRRPGSRGRDSYQW